MNINENQAIKFLGENEETFNNEQICGCDNSEKFSYLFTDGDTIDFQIDGTCEDGEDLIVNGSFEEGESATSITSWARDVTNEEQTTVTRVIDNSAPCGVYVAKWVNENPTPNFAQLEQNYTFVQGRSYKVTLKAKIVASGANVGNILEIIAGGVSYYITPTTSWAEYELIITFNSAPSTPYFQIKMNEIPTDVSEMYVDCVSMVELGECCIFNHVNNGCFELGQQDGESVDATFDNWTTQGSESLAGGINGTRCFVFQTIGDFAEQDNVLLTGKNIIKFWAKSDILGTTIDLTSLSSGFVIDSLILTTTWTQYTYDYINSTDDGIRFELTGDNISYLDCVETYFVPEINLTIVGEDVAIPVSPDVISVYDGYINVSIPINDYDFPECFQICVETCLGDLFLNSDFELGSGNLFTYWTLTQPSRTNLIFRSQEFDNAYWVKANVSVTANSVIAPDGTTTADTITEAAVNSSFHIDSGNTTVTNGATYTMSAFVKMNGRRYVLLYEGFSDIGVFFDLQTGTALGSLGAGTLVNSDIHLDKNGFYRIIVTYVQSGTTASLQMYLSNDGTGVAYNGNGTSGIYAWGAQLEQGAFAKPYIPTTNAAVTTSFGEFLQDATGGINGSRCLKMWVDIGGVLTELVQNVDLVAGVNYTVRFFAKLDAIYGNDFISVNGTSKAIDSLDWKQYTLTFTQGVTATVPFYFRYINDANYGFINLDNLDIIETSAIEETCSENMKYIEDLNACTKELVWYDNRPISSGINYASGFKNRVRINANLNNPQYNIVTYVKNINDGVSKINRVQIKKNTDLAMQAMPEFLLDRVAGLISVSNIEYGGVELCSTDETEISVQTSKDSRLYDCTITLAPKEEYLINTSYNCS